jgi:hypothetical protein
MRVKVVIAIAGFILFGWNGTSAQIYSLADQAIIFSRIQPGGDARIRAMGGTQNSLGGDISSAFYNPAGLGMYNRSDFSITGGYTMANTAASYLGNQTAQSTNGFNVPNFGIAFHSNKDGTKGLWGGTFAINFNRVNDFNNTITYSGTNKDNSIIDYFINSANGRDSTQFQPATNSSPEGVNYNTPTGLAFNNYLIGPKSDYNSTLPKDEYFSYVPLQPTIQKEVINTSGAQNQWSFSYGVNFNDKIFLGGGIGLTSFKYKTSTTYTETYTQDPLFNMQLNETLEQSGTGINATFGLIARPVDKVQLGFSVATPTAYEINETYSASMSSAWNNFQYFVRTPPEYLNNLSEKTDIVSSTYSFSTPWRVSGGLTYFFEKKGFISADAEWLSYGSSSYSSNMGQDFSSYNSTIKSQYKSVINLRFGGEYRMDKYRFRAGYNYMPDPYTSDQHTSISSFSTGAGYRTSKFYVDLAFVYSQGLTSHSPYPSSPVASLNNKPSSILFTIGFPF